MVLFKNKDLLLFIKLIIYIFKFNGVNLLKVNTLFKNLFQKALKSHFYLQKLLITFTIFYLLYAVINYI